MGGYRYTLDANKNAIIGYYAGSENALVIPSVTAIGEMAFYGCSRPKAYKTLFKKAGAGSKAVFKKN